MNEPLTVIYEIQKINPQLLEKKKDREKNKRISWKNPYFCFLEPFHIKGRFLHFTSEFKMNGSQAVISENKKIHPQLMINTYIWWKKIYVQVGKSPRI